MDAGPFPPKRKKCTLQTPTKELLSTLGISDFCDGTENELKKQTPAEWIDTVLEGKAAVKREKIHQNIQFYLGGGRIVQNISEAVNLVFERDFKKARFQISNHIYVPEQRIASRQLLRQFQNETEESLDMRLAKLSLDEKEKDRIKNQRNALEGELVELDLYDTLKSYFENYRREDQILFIHSYNFAKKVLSAEHKEKDFIIVNKTLGYIMNIEAKKKSKDSDIKSATKQLENTKELLMNWFGGDELLKNFKFIAVFYTHEPGEPEVENNFWIHGQTQVHKKLDKIHVDLSSQKQVSSEDFETLVKNLLFYTTVMRVPIMCNFDNHVNKSFQGIQAEDVAFWNLTPGQVSILQAPDLKCVMFTSAFSTGKTMLMLAKARQVALSDKVVFILALEHKLTAYAPVMLRAKIEETFKDMENVEFESVESSEMLNVIAKHSNKSIFVDEMIVRHDFDWQKLEELAKDLGATGHFLWMVVSKTESKRDFMSIHQHFGGNSDFAKWTWEQDTFHIPKLRFSMRNCKDIFTEAQKTTSAFSVSGLGLKNALNDFWLEPLEELTFSELPQNTPQGRVPPAIIGRKGDSLEDLLTQAFKYFPSQRVIVVLDSGDPDYLTANGVANVIKAVRGIYPEVLQQNFSHKLQDLDFFTQISRSLFHTKSESDFASLVLKAKRWLSDENNKQDLVAHEWHLGGFEWPSIIYITSVFYSGDKQPSQDLVMRTISTFVKVVYTVYDDE